MIEFEDVIYLFPDKINNEFRAFIQIIISEKIKASKVAIKN